MTTWKILKHLSVLFVSILVTIPALGSGSAYAVFKVSYNGSGGTVVGGVAGTAFFISRDQALSALHVINENTFKPVPGFQKARVWLVHEGEKALEIKPEDVRFMAGKDMSRIQFPRVVVPARQVFQAPVTGALKPSDAVETEGFLAQSAGPVLVWKGSELAIESVPQLQRIRFHGKLLRQAVISLQALDVQLNQTPALELSYQPVVGTSGGPVTSRGRLIGLNSFANPETRQTTWAVLLNSL